MQIGRENVRPFTSDSTRARASQKAGRSISLKVRYPPEALDRRPKPLQCIADRLAKYTRTGALSSSSVGSRVPSYSSPGLDPCGSQILGDPPVHWANQRQELCHRLGIVHLVLNQESAADPDKEPSSRPDSCGKASRDSS